MTIIGTLAIVATVTTYIRVVAQGLAHLVRDQGVGGSNPLYPIKLFNGDKLFNLLTDNNLLSPFLQRGDLAGCHCLNEHVA